MSLLASQLKARLGGGDTLYDPDGVIKLLPDDPAGLSWHLGTQNPNNLLPYFKLYESVATQQTEGGLTFWCDPGQNDGSSTGRTHRLYVRPSGGSQTYTWLNTPGYLGNANDVMNLEATAYIRPHTKISGSVNTSLSWIIRGGNHGSISAQGSCTGMQIPYTGQTAKTFREYNHPNYDYIFPPRNFVYNFPGNTWLGTKIISYKTSSTSTRNELWLDTSPWTGAAPTNNFQLYMTWNDTNTDTGLYTIAAWWAGWQTSIRLDGFTYLDFAIYSIREILAP